jgi:transketolase
MNAIDPKLPTFIGGSADLDPSTHTALAGRGDFESPRETIDDPQGSSEAAGSTPEATSILVCANTAWGRS